MIQGISQPALFHRLGRSHAEHVHLGRRIGVRGIIKTCCFMMVDRCELAEKSRRFLSERLLMGVLALSFNIWPVRSCDASQAYNLDQAPTSEVSTVPIAIPFLGILQPGLVLLTEQFGESTPSAPSLLDQSMPRSSPVYCEADKLVYIFQEFVRDEGFATEASPVGLYQFYRQLGCSDEQLTFAINKAFDIIPKSQQQDQDWKLSLGSISSPKILLSELALAFLIMCFILYQRRPRGWARRDLVRMGPSQISGTGLFAIVDIPENTKLGSYPGHLRTAGEMSAKVIEAPGAASYAFSTGRGMYLDPTDARGNGPSEYPGPGYWWPLQVQLDLAFVNEPPPGSSGTNCTVEDGSDEADLLFVSSRNIRAGEEVLIDYGRVYNRSEYGQ